GVEGFFDVSLGGAGEHGDPAGRLIAHDLHDPLPLLRGEAGELTGGAVGVQAMHAAVDEPVDVTTELSLVDLTSAVEGDQVRSEDAVDTLAHGVRVQGSEDAWGKRHLAYGKGIGWPEPRCSWRRAL